MEGRAEKEDPSVELEVEGHAGFEPYQDPYNWPVTTPAATEEDPGDYGGWWSMEKEDSLIDAYQKAPHLWDKAAPGFKTRNKKDLALTKWSDELKIPSKYGQREDMSLQKCG